MYEKQDQSEHLRISAATVLLWHNRVKETIQKFADIGLLPDRIDEEKCVISDGALFVAARMHFGHFSAEIILPVPRGHWEKISWN